MKRLLPAGVRRPIRLTADFLRTGKIRRIDRWSIGLYEGRSPIELRPLDGIRNPVLTRRSVRDADAEFVADPFLVPAGGKWFMFFEVMNRRSGRGEIGMASSASLMKWSYEAVVLKEPFHLSYPYVLEWGGEYFMIPESSAIGEVRLYRAIDFPRGWVLDRVLLRDRPYNDASVFVHDGRWWMLVGSSPTGGGELRLFGAPDVRGPWTEHPESPVVSEKPATARPAGRIVADGRRLLRFAQDCSRVYGEQIRAFEIESLDGRTYRERPVGPDPLLGPSGTGWNALRMHTIDLHRLADGRWIGAADGRGY